MHSPLPAACGPTWFKQALNIIRQQPLGFYSLVVFYILVSGLLSSLPVLGGVLAGIWMPFGALMLAFAARDAQAGIVPTIRPLLAAVKKPVMRQTLFGLGITYAIWMEVILLVFNLMAAPHLNQWVVTDQGIDFDSVLAHLPVAAVLVGVILYIPALMATCFAPVLAGDAGLGIGKSLFFSFFGVLRNFAACAAAALAFVGLALIVGLSLDLIFMLTGLSGLLPYFGPLYVIAFTGIGQAMIWPMYCGLYGEKHLFEQLP